MGREDEWRILCARLGIGRATVGMKGVRFQALGDMQFVFVMSEFEEGHIDGDRKMHACMYAWKGKCSS